MNREPPKGPKWPAEGSHHRWGSTRGNAHTQVPEGRLNSNLPGSAWLLDVELSTGFDSRQPRS